MFPTNKGVKQGDVLSTFLFNIYINHLPGELLEDSRFSKTMNDRAYLDDVAKRDLQKKVSILE